MLIAPSGSRNVSFGLGMDNVTINSLIIQTLRVNRDATNSTVTVSRSIQNMIIGGNVENTNIQAGYSQSLFEDDRLPADEPARCGQRRLLRHAAADDHQPHDRARVGIARAVRPERRLDHRPDLRQYRELGDLGVGQPEPVRPRRRRWSIDSGQFEPKTVRMPSPSDRRITWSCRAA